MTFGRPMLLLLLALPVLMAWWEWTRRGHPLVLPFDHGKIRRGRFLQKLVAIFSMMPPLLAAVAIVILAGPQRLRTAESEKVLTNIQMCLDVSGSMTAQYGNGTRYDAAMQSVIDFTSYRPGDAFGLTIFGNEVLHWVPITKDLSAIRLATPFLKPDNMPHYFGGTQIGKALRECQKMLASRPEGDRMIILMSDGDSADLGSTRSNEIAQELRAARIVVYPILVGGESSTDDMYIIANITGGQVFQAGDPVALQEVFRHIDKMQATKMKPPSNEFADFFAPVSIAGLAAVALHLVSLLGVRYTPW
jgi:Ca-activated chloride channel family protein